MKRYLCAIAALATFAPSVSFAQEQTANNIKLSIGGYFAGYATYVDQDDGPGGEEARDFDIVRDTEPNFSGEVTLDNGLTVGGYVGVDGDQGGGFDIADSFAYFSGDWGKVDFGYVDGVTYILQVSIPSSDPNVDGKDVYVSAFNYDVTGIAELQTIRDDGIDYDQDMTAGDKISYITPKFGNFQAGISYSPEVTDDTSRDFGNALDDEAGGFGDAWEVAALYCMELESVTAYFGAGYTYHDLEQSNASFGDDRQAWNVGADFDIGAFGIGAVYTQDDHGDRDDQDSDARQIGVGVDYTIGSYVLGASYFDQNNEFGANEIDTSRYAGGVTYMQARASVSVALLSI